MERIDRRGAEILYEAALQKLKAEDAGLHEVVSMLVKLDAPGKSAFTLMATAIVNPARDWPPVVNDIVRALLRHQSHLDYESGRADGVESCAGETPDESARRALYQRVPVEGMPAYKAKLHEAPRTELVSLVGDIVDIFYPGGDPDHDCGSDEIGEVTNMLVTRGFAPTSTEKE